MEEDSLHMHSIFRDKETHIASIKSEIDELMEQKTMGAIVRCKAVVQFPQNFSTWPLRSWGTGLETMLTLKG